jgi:ribonuclease HI
VVEQLYDDALTIYTDGSGYSRPRRGGIGFRFVWTDNDGYEAVHDSDLAGYRQATNNQMELKAAIEALREAVARWTPVDVTRFRKIVLYSDSNYLVSNYSRARFQWARDGWVNTSGRPIANARLWQALLKAIDGTGKRVDVNWIPGKKGPHAKAVDKLAKKSANGHLNPPLSPSRVRRSKTPAQVDVGSVRIEGQELIIYVRTGDYMEIQRLYRYRYEVVDDDSPYNGCADDIYSERDLLLSPGHIYAVRVNGEQSNPRVLELLEEIIDSGDDA